MCAKDFLKGFFTATGIIIAFTFLFFHSEVLIKCFNFLIVFLRYKFILLAGVFNKMNFIITYIIIIIIYHELGYDQVTYRRRF